MTPQSRASNRQATGQPYLAWLKELGNSVVDLLFPPRCVACHRLGAWLCTNCMADVEVIHPPVCPRCGLPLDKQTFPHPQGPQPCCAQCEKKTPRISEFRACAIHGGPLRTAISHFKYNDLRALAAPLGKLMGDGWPSLFAANGDPDVIVPIPLHTARLRERGYNQAALLAHELGILLQKPVVEDALVRIKATKRQVDLDASARRDNVKDAFQCKNSRLAGQKVLLVDDVCTTGSTLEAACIALQDGGMSSVWAYTLARARGETGPVSNKT